MMQLFAVVHHRPRSIEFAMWGKKVKDMTK
jgi:hypothetical protein